MYVRLREQLAAKCEKLGGRLAVGPGVGDQHSLVGLPLLSNPGEIPGPGVGLHAQPDQLLVTGQDLEAVCRGPEHTPVSPIERACPANSDATVIASRTRFDVIPSASGHR